MSATVGSAGLIVLNAGRPTAAGSGPGFEVELGFGVEVVTEDQASGGSDCGMLGILAGRWIRESRAAGSENAVLFVVGLDVADRRLSNPVVVGSSPKYPGLSWAPSGDRFVLDVQGERDGVAVMLVEDDLHLTDPFVVDDGHLGFAVSPHWSGTD